MRLLLAALTLATPLQGMAWLTNNTPRIGSVAFSRKEQFQLKSFLTDIGDMVTGGTLTPQRELAHGRPLGPINDTGEVQTLAIQERPVSFTGEDYDVYDVSNDRPFCRVQGAMLHLPGKDKMTVTMEGGHRKVAVLDRKLMAKAPTYDIYRGDTHQKLGWLEKQANALQHTFDLYLEGGGGFGGVFKSSPPVYRIEGDFMERRLVMKNGRGEVVAKVTKDWIIEYDNFNHYQVQVAPGMDSALVVACACAIDEEFDEEHREKKKRKDRARRTRTQ